MKTSKVNVCVKRIISDVKFTLHHLHFEELFSQHQQYHSASLRRISRNETYILQNAKLIFI